MSATKITINIQNQDGSLTALEPDVNSNQSLMEFLVSSEYPILATCDGMALCGTCCVDILKGEDQLNEIGDDEYYMLDTIPDALSNSRLSCQLKIDEQMDGLVLKLH